MAVGDWALDICAEIQQHHMWQEDDTTGGVMEVFDQAPPPAGYCTSMPDTDTDSDDGDGQHVGQQVQQQDSDGDAPPQLVPKPARTWPMESSSDEEMGAGEDTDTEMSDTDVFDLFLPMPPSNSGNSGVIHIHGTSSSNNNSSGKHSGEEPTGKQLEELTRDLPGTGFLMPVKVGITDSACAYPGLANLPPEGDAALAFTMDNMKQPVLPPPPATCTFMYTSTPTEVVAMGIGSSSSSSSSDDNIAGSVFQLYGMPPTAGKQVAHMYEWEKEDVSRNTTVAKSMQGGDTGPSALDDSPPARQRAAGYTLLGWDFDGGTWKRRIVAALKDAGGGGLPPPSPDCSASTVSTVSFSGKPPPVGQQAGGATGVLSSKAALGWLFSSTMPRQRYP
jgi:hypothetical protein